MTVTDGVGGAITKDEISTYFLSKYGDCIVHLHLGKHPSSSRPKYAIPLMKNSKIVHKILGNKEKIRTSINKKEVFIRKFFPESEYKGYA